MMHSALFRLKTISLFSRYITHKLYVKCSLILMNILNYLQRKKKQELPVDERPKPVWNDDDDETDVV